MLPRIAITAGEPAGIGPDIVIMAAQREHNAELVVFADPELLAERAQMLGLPLTLQVFSDHAPTCVHQPGTLKIVPIKLAVPCQPGQLNPENSAYVLQTLQDAIQACVQGQCQALATGPVQKSVINDAGIPFTGHTEFFAEQTHTPQAVMMLACSEMRVALATTHLPLTDVPASITRELLDSTLRILHRELIVKFGVPTPKIAVLGLNPHAGEGGHMGREEIDTIIPVLQHLRNEGLNLQGPLPADTAFNPKVLNNVDAVFAMYHDQGLPVLKYAGFGSAINITLGLPVIRTSVDHGTALDLAGSGDADASSFDAAINAAVEMSNLQPKAPA